MPATDQRHTLSRKALRDHFLEGSKKPADFRVGVEWEKVGVHRDTGRAIGYSGERGVETLFRELAARFGWEPEREGGHVTALRKDGSWITLEPGGQIELSGRKARTLDENAAELEAHLREIKDVSEPLGIVWLGLGLQPISAVDEIEWVPKERYRIMRKSLKGRGSLTHAMMKQTAAIQISLDFSDEKDAVEKLRLGMGLAPFLTVLFANSAVSEGSPNGYFSKRAHIWAHTAPERTGVLPDIFREDFTLDHYIDYALDIPLLFVIRNGRWLDAGRIPFREYLKTGAPACHTPVLADWDLHLSSIFTEARLRKYIEIRSIDAQKAGFGMAVPALVKGLIYDAEARRKAHALIMSLDETERTQLAADAPLKGLETPFRGGTIKNVCIDLLEWSRRGLARLEGEGLAGPSEDRYLEPLRDLLVNRGMTPAQILLRCLEKGTSREDTVRSVIRCGAL